MDSGTASRNYECDRNRWFRETTVPGRSLPVWKQVLNNRQCNKYMLWIDGVGAWQVCVGHEFVMGAPSFEQRSADIALQANVSRRHATLQESGEEWTLTAHQPTRVSGQNVESPVLLRSGDQICLADRVHLGFRVPSVLSTSAVIDFESDHRPSYSVDGIILLTDHCLLGPRRDHHVFCSHWSEMVVLFSKDSKLYCRSRQQLTVDNELVDDCAVLEHGSVVCGDDLRFRVERLE